MLNVAALNTDDKSTVVIVAGKSGWLLFCFIVKVLELNVKPVTYVSAVTGKLWY
jgi:hypothetical protein